MHCAWLLRKIVFSKGLVRADLNTARVETKITAVGMETTRQLGMLWGAVYWALEGAVFDGF